MRITGGRWRSRPLRAPRGTSTRPTSDRVREALFSILASRGVLAEGEEGPRVLDLYAGSGALALEALSRGARSAVVVEHGRDAVQAIRENVRALDAEASVRVVTAKVESALAKITADFGVVFADPPYADVTKKAFSEVLTRAAHALIPGGTLVLEHAASDPPPTCEVLVLDDTRRYGDTALSFYTPKIST